MTATVVSMLTSTTGGVNVRVGAMEQADSSLRPAGIRTIVALNASVDISEKTGYVQYPALLVYCDKLSNTLKEKFREFSGKAHAGRGSTAIAGHARRGLNRASRFMWMPFARCSTIRGAIGAPGSFYAGGYDVSYEPVGRGGSNFLQRAKVGFDVEVSK